MPARCYICDRYDRGSVGPRSLMANSHHAHGYQRPVGPASLLGWLLWHTLARVRRQRVASGQSPQEPRVSRAAECQRREALGIVSDHAPLIRAAAVRHSVPPEAVAGAILWEGLENPYRRRHWRLGPGKVRATELWRPADAMKVELEGRIPGASGLRERLGRLRDPSWAIQYVAAIQSRHADVYLRLASVRIRHDIAVLCTLYQGGDSELRAARLADRRSRDPTAMPRAGNDMGPWVVTNLEFVRRLIGTEIAQPPATRGRALRPAAARGSAASTSRV